MPTILNKESIVFGTYVSMETIICFKCAIPFGVPSNYKEHLHSSKDTFYCPNGHPQCYSKSTETILRERLAKEQKDREEEALRLKAKIYDKEQEAANWQKQWAGQLKEKKKAERKLKRLNNGVCACCNRSFENLHDHMLTQHPEVLGKTKPIVPAQKTRTTQHAKQCKK